MATDTEKGNMELMRSLDDAWNRQDWEMVEVLLQQDSTINE